MSELDEEELLDAIRKNREAREIRREAIEFLRERGTRNLPMGIFYFALAALCSISNMWFDAKMEGEPDASSMIIRVTVVVVCVWFGIRFFQTNPRDRLLLLLAEESQAKDPPISSGGKKDDADLP